MDGWLDLILEAFSNLNDSVILSLPSRPLLELQVRVPVLWAPLTTAPQKPGSQADCRGRSLHLRLNLTCVATW